MHVPPTSETGDRPGNRSRTEDEHPEISNVSPCFFPFPLVENTTKRSSLGKIIGTHSDFKEKEVRHWIPKITSGGWSASGLATPTC